MAWNQGGGGPWGGGSGGGGGGNSPWGRPGGGGFGGKPPDIEEMLRRSQEKVKRMVPGGFGTGRGAGLIAVVAVALWLASGFYRVQPDELGIELWFGKYTEQTAPGLHWRPPAPIASVLTPKVTRINTIDVGFRAGVEGRQRSRAVAEEGLMLTGDENIIDIQYTVFWKIADPGLFLFNIVSPEATVKAAGESAMREVVGQMQANLALAEGRTRIETDTQRLMQRILDDYGAGVLVTQVQLRGVEPPQQVLDAFRDVQRAKADRERDRNQAEAYRNDIVPRARGEAQRVVQEAEAYKQQAIAHAQGEASRFISVYEAFRTAPDVTKQRLYLETMEIILRSNAKFIIDQPQGGAGVLPYLPLQELQQRRPNTPAGPAQPQAQQGGRQ
jgi:membrane protease subunit HflK